MDVQKFVLIPYTMWESQQAPQQNFTLLPPPPPPAVHNTSSISDQASTTTTTTTTPPPPPPPSSPPPPISSKSQNLKTSLESELKKDHNAKKILEKLFEADNIDFSTTQTIIVDSVDTKLNVIEFIHTLRRKRQPVDDRHLLILDQLKLNPQLVINENALDKESGEWIPFTF